MKNTLIAILAFLTLAPVAYGAFGDPFISIQLATDPDDGECLTTDGTDNVWDTCGGGSQTPWTSDIDADQFSLLDLLGLEATRSTTTHATTTTFHISSLFNFGGDVFDELVGDGLAVSNGDLIFDCSDVAGTGITCSGEDITAEVITAGDGLTKTLLDLDCDTADTNTFGCLTAVDWDTFNGKENVLTFGDALTRTGDDIDFDGGASPGGELGGTWASPTIDDSLSVTGWTLGDATSTTFAITSLGTAAGTFLAANPDGTIIATTTPSGTSVSFGTDNQIPYTNSSTDDFDYSANFTFDGSILSIIGTASSTKFLANNGSGSAPGYSFASDTDTGMHLNSAGVLRFVAGSVEILDISSSGLSVYNGGLALGSNNLTMTGAFINDTGSLEIPNGTGPTVDAIGEIAFDTTDNQFLYGTSTDSTSPAVINPYTAFSVSYASTTQGQATSTIYIGTAPYALSVRQAQCDFSNFMGISLYDGTNRANYFEASSTVGTVTYNTNNTFTAGEVMRLDVGTSTNIAADVRGGCTFRTYPTRQ